ncbi:MAG: hypothetical protein ACQEQS_03380 [Thermodesulfobacteriota bacterium]
MKKFVLFSILINICFVFGFSEIKAETNKFIFQKTVGSAEIEDGKRSEAQEKARDKAISDAFSNAVLSLVPEKVINKKFEDIFSVIESAAPDTAEEFQVMGEVIKDDKYIIAVRSSFSKKMIDQKLASAGIMIEEIELPEIVLLVSQKGLEDFTAYQWWHDKSSPSFSSVEKAMQKELADMDFKVLKPFSVKNDSDDFEEDSVPDKKEAVNIGLDRDADVVVVGRAEALPGRNRIGDKETIQVSVSLMVIKTDSGEELYNFSKDVMVTIEENLESSEAGFDKAGEVAGEKIGKFLVSHWKEVLDSSREIDIETSGSNYLPKFIKFKNHLSQENIVKDLREKEITAQGSIITTVFSGSPQELAEEIVKIPFNSFGIEITDISENKIRIRFVSDQQ